MYIQYYPAGWTVRIIFVSASLGGDDECFSCVDEIREKESGKIEKCLQKEQINFEKGRKKELHEKKKNKEKSEKKEPSENEKKDKKEKKKKAKDCFAAAESKIEKKCGCNKDQRPKYFQEKDPIVFDVDLE